ncbi:MULTISPECIES: transglycosylase SLT domain-containing protein [unclassified Polaribacter]|uniref:transglycosylase SLT domain-containing protein n=1 Tax=unclassified Polaribacter TaxID=196858 RepID=UPI0011BE4323|nr:MULTISPECIES: transporter substrate-binding domain-containing protein [unclassified Polaribacter]TXD53333.1 transporter substrate-binding domain-containing protein [Polaribacter sp. IC063]TXD57160.1 transporter substrate-binding domain-containing protein [Polaribacter sp. IC066]
MKQKKINSLGSIVLVIIAIISLNLTSCKQQKENKIAAAQSETNPFLENSVNRDLEAIKEDGILRASVVYSSTSYFLYRGQAMGFEYDLLTQLAEHLGLKLELVVSSNLDTQFEVLNRGDVDLIAHGMTITNQRKWEVDFTEHLYLTRQVLVQKKPDNYLNMSWGSVQKKLIHDPIELIDKTISIRKNSSYIERILSLSNEIGGNIIIDTLDSKLSTDEIIDMVANGEIEYTIADENLAKINASFNPILKIDVPISFSQRIAWVTRKKSPLFRKVVNEWIVSQRRKRNFNVTYNKYFKNKRTFKQRIRSNYYSLKNNQISKYDNLIKIHADKIGWDWRLLASQVYQESRFDPVAKSWAGAKGLMQVMPATAKSLGITDVSDPHESIRGGTDYLDRLYNKFTDINDSINRIKFSLASYNCGYSHVRDAQRLAVENDLDATIWSENVETMILALSLPKNYNKPFIKYGYVRGKEPANYIEQIFERYDHYKQFIPLE